MDPIDGTTTNPILRKAKDAVNNWISTDCAVVGVMLDVESDQSEEESLKTRQIPEIASC